MGSLNWWVSIESLHLVALFAPFEYKTIEFQIAGGWGMMEFNGLISLVIIASLLGFVGGHGVQPLSKISIHRATMAIHHAAHIKASPSLLGFKV